MAIVEAPEAGVRVGKALAESAAPRALVSADRVYIPALDGIRFLAFAGVFFHHLEPGDAFASVSVTLSRTLMRLSTFGWLGVDLFFCLSGFLIATLLLREIDTTGTVSISRFYARRILRIWPLYYLMISIAFFLAPLLLGQFGSEPHRAFLATHLFPFMTLFGNFSYAYFYDTFPPMVPAAGFAAPLWTIALEEQFYLVFPLILALVPRVSTRAVLWSATSVLILSALSRLYFLGNGVPYPMVWTNTLSHLDPIVLGVVGAVLWHRHGAALARLRLFGADVVAACGAFVLVMSFPQVGQSLHTVWQFTATGLGALLLILAALRYRPIGAALGWRPVAWLGRISYGLYVFHVLAIWLYGQALGPSVSAFVTSAPLHRVLDLILAFGLTVALAAASYYAYERPFLRFKEKFAVVLSREA